MKTIYLVDDEPLVTETIKTLVDWNSYGMCICGTANNGISAQKDILEKQPDLVITDIRMPGINGLELIASVQKQLPDTQFAIISGYNDFNYIRAALRLNIVDYLDKPVTVEKIQSMLLEVQHIFEERESHSVKIRSDETIKQQLQYLILDSTGSVQNLPEQLKGMQIIHVMAIKGNQTFCRMRLQDILCNVFLPMGIDSVLMEIDGKFVSVGWSFRAYEMEKVCSAVKNALSAFFADGTIIAVGISDCYETFGVLKTAYIEATCARKYAEFFGDEIVEITSIYTKEDEQIDLVFKDHIGLLLRTGEWEKAEKAVEEIFQQMERLRPNPDLVRHICLEILYLSISVCSESGKEYTEDGRPFLPHVIISSMTRAEDVRAWTQETFHRIVVWLQKRREQASHKDIAKAKRYIDEHYSEAITLRMLADMCYMNPNYFSAIFRDNVGMTYVKYLNVVRMEHAKEMIRAGKKIKIVSEKCGFQNTRYFSEKFKNYTGVTPEQYRLGDV